MTLYWISYSSDDDPRRPGRRGRRWRWRWPWQWFRFGPRQPRSVAAPDRRRSRGGGERRSIWPLLLLLLLLLLILGTVAYFLLDDSDEEAETERTASTGNLDPPSGPVGVPGLPSAGITVGDPDGVPGDGQLSASAPDLSSLNISGDTTFMDLGGESCQEERYVLMTDGRMHTIDQLDDETVEALTQSEVPIDTISLDGGGDTTALQTIAKRTGGTFTMMER